MSQTITIQIEVPISEVDFSACTVYRARDLCEFWGAPFTAENYDGDLSGAKWNGHKIELSDAAHDTAMDYLIAKTRVAA